MKIVIDIPEEIYKKSVGFGHLDMCGIELANAVLNGTPLTSDVPDINVGNKNCILDKIRGEIAMYEADCRLQGGTDECEKCNSNVFGSIYRIIDKYRSESEERNDRQ